MDRGIETPFSADTYHTPPTPRSLLDRLFPTRWSLYVPHMAVVVRASWLASRGLLDDVAWVKSSLAVFRRAERCGVTFHLFGLDHLRRQTRPVVLASNHMSAAETQLFPCIIAPFLPVTFVVKRSLVTHPVFGPIMRSRDPVVVSRKDPRRDMEAVLTKGGELLRRGVSVVVFPQATRRLVFVPEQFNTLAVKLAREAGVEVMPVAVKTDFWGNGRVVRDFGPLDRSKPAFMAFGAPMAIQGHGREQHRAVLEFIEAHLRAWGAPVASH